MDSIPPGDDRRPEGETPEPQDSRDRIDWEEEPQEAAPPRGDETPDGGEALPPFPPADTDENSVWMDPDYVEPLPPPVRSSGGLLTGVVVGVLALSLIAATLWGIREYRQRALVLNAAQQALALISAGAPPELAKEMSDIQAYLTAGQADQAAQRLETLRAAMGQKQPGAAGAAGGGGEAIPETAYNDLPPDAAQFFRAHQDLFRKFLLMCAKARELKAQGKNVDELRKVRDRTIEAARLGQQPEVEKYMQQMYGMLRGEMGGEERGPLGKKAQRLKAAVNRATERGRDVRAVFPLMKKAEQAAEAGNFEQAEKYIDQALAAVRSAPRRTGGDFARRMRNMRQGRANPLAPFARVLLGVMAAEEANLKAVTQDLLQMRQWVLSDTPEKPAEPQELSPVIDRALGEMQTMSNRRQELARTMRSRNAKGRPGDGALAQLARRQQLTPEQRREMFALLLERLNPILDEARKLSDADYQAQRPSLIRSIVAAVLERPRPNTAVAPEPAPLPSDPEQRVRAKMLEASKVLKQWELQGNDTAPAEELFAKARKALYARDYAEAEKLVDEARKLLGMTETPGTQEATVGGTGDNGIKLNLRGRP